jgi:hypothetical protein
MGQPPYTRFVCCEPEALVPFPLEDVAGWFKQSNDRIYAATAPLAEFEISSALPAGTHRIAVPAEFGGIDELLVVSPYLAGSNDEPCCAIHVVWPAAGEVTVFPQRWFTADKVDVGYQWITRVARDPLSGRLVGDGIRIKAFELSEDGTEVARWLE